MGVGGAGDRAGGPGRYESKAVYAGVGPKRDVDDEDLERRDSRDAAEEDLWSKQLMEDLRNAGATTLNYLHHVHYHSHYLGR